MGNWKHTVTLSLDQIWVDRESRQRKELEVDDLEVSIKKHGLIQPIIVEMTAPDLRATKPMFKLVAGERRLTAIKNLGLASVVAREVTDLTPIEFQLLELEENIKRQDLTWQEITNAVGKVHALHMAMDSEWTMGETADACGLTLSTVSLYLRVNSEIDSNVRVAEAGTVREAYNIVSRRDARQAGAALEELIAPVAPRPTRSVEVLAEGENVVALDVPGARPQPLPPPVPVPVGPPPVEETLLEGSFLDWAKGYSGSRFNFIHCDFPYGIDFAAGPQGLGSETSVYGDEKDVYFSLLESLLENLDKLLGHSGHIMFWYSEQHGEATRKLFRDKAPTLKLLRHPLIWVKSDNAGISPDSKRTPRHIYETAMLFSRGDRQLVQVKADAYSAPTDKKLHPSTKPEPMLKHFFTMLVDDYTQMLDPTAGSGASLRAAEGLGAKRVQGLEIDPQYIGPARQALSTARKLRAAEKMLT